MNNIDLVIMAMQNLWRRKLRTALTILGVMIGASSIVVMLSLGFGISKSLENQLASWGSLTVITVYPGMGPSGNSKTAAKLDKASVNKFKQIPNVVGVNATKETYGKILIGRFEASSPIIGVDPNIMEAFDFKISEGRLLNESDKLSIVYGGGMAENFYNPKSKSYQPAKVDLLKDKAKLSVDSDSSSSNPNAKPKEYAIKAVGVLSPDDYETSYGVYMPIKQLEKLMAENNKDPKTKNTDYSSVKIKADDIKSVEAIQDTVKEMGFEAYSPKEQLDSIKQQTLVMQTVLGGIGAISLIVAAIGITNTMIMSIYERTKEIGIMKVIGASIKDIRKLFLLEAGFIGLFGGVCGLIFSYIASIILNIVAVSFISNLGGIQEGSTISIIPIPLALGALIFSMLIGILSGYFPAKRAMKLSALEAIKSE